MRVAIRFPNMTEGFEHTFCMEKNPIITSSYTLCTASLSTMCRLALYKSLLSCHMRKRKRLQARKPHYEFLMWEFIMHWWLESCLLDKCALKGIQIKILLRCTSLLILKDIPLEGDFFIQDGHVCPSV